MSCSGNPDCLCGCCAGTSVQTPQQAVNRPGLGSVSYRVGTWAAFKESMLAKLSSSDYPALALLKTREDDDFTIAFLDATAMMLDILTFYQERLANESYLRTATQLRSLTELSRLIAYVPAPGVSASTYLAFTLKAAPGLPTNPNIPAITIPQGTQVQSVPAQGQTPQTFETSADILAKPDWNALPVQSTQSWLPNPGDTSLYLAGIATQLNPGDAILIVGDERSNASTTNSGWTTWDIRILLTVTADAANNRTYITWNEGLGGDGGSPARANPKVFAFRQRAALFGYNAIDPNLLNTTNTSITRELNSSGTAPTTYSWKGYNLATTIDLDSTYPKIVQKGWVALVKPDDGASATSTSNRSLPGFVGLFQVSAVSAVARTAFGLSAKISRVVPDTPPSPSDFDLNKTLALVQSEELAVAEQPLTYPLFGTVMDLADLRPDLAGTQVVVLSGTRQKISILAGSPGSQPLKFVPDLDDGSGNLTLKPGDVLTLTDGVALASLPVPTPIATAISPLQIPPWSSVGPAIIDLLNVEDPSGRTGTVQNVPMNQFVLAPSDPKDPEVSEYALVSSEGPVSAPYPHTQFQLKSPLANCYDRTTVIVNANVGEATHGQSVSEIMGSGSASTPNQSFQLKQFPLTFVQAPTSSGRLSTLQLQVNSTTWSEVPSLYNQGSTSPVFATLNQPGGNTEVIFGDGIEGALLPTGQNNLQANYRIGSGSIGNVGENSLTTLMDRPLGVSGVTNPQAANGGQDAQVIEDIRSNAPLTVLTLGRAVSITDYQNYAGAFAGIAKAYAVWVPSGPGRGVFLTVAGVDGAAFPNGSATLTNLVTSLQSYGNPLIPITVASYVETLFKFSADLQYDPRYDQSAVQTQAFKAVSEAFSFEAQTFGQGVSIDEVAAIIQQVPGVVAVNVTGLWRTSSSTGGDLSSQENLSVAQLNAWQAALINLPRVYPDTTTQLYAYLPVANLESQPYPAEILVLDPSLSATSLGVMS